MALTKKELEESARGYAVMIGGRIVQIICETCRKRFCGMGVMSMDVLRVIGECGRWKAEILTPMSLIARR